MWRSSARTIPWASTRSVHAPRPVLVSSFWDIQPQFSPDGNQLVFASSRSGEALDIWLAAADGSNAHQLTHGPRQLARAHPRGHRTVARLRLIPRAPTTATRASGPLTPRAAPARRITNGPGDQRRADMVSRRARGSTFASEQEGSASRCRGECALTGGSPERVTRRRQRLVQHWCRWMARHSIYKREFGDSPLLALPLAGGPGASTAAVRVGA